MKKIICALLLSACSVAGNPNLINEAATVKPAPKHHFPIVVAEAEDVPSNGVASVSPVILFTFDNPPNGFYRVNGYVKAVGVGNSDNVVLDATYTDPADSTPCVTTVLGYQPIAVTGNPIDDTVGSFVQGTAVFRASSAASIVVRLSTSSQTSTLANATLERLK